MLYQKIYREPRVIFKKFGQANGTKKNQLMMKTRLILFQLLIPKRIIKQVKFKGRTKTSSSAKSFGKSMRSTLIRLLGGVEVLHRAMNSI